MRQRVKIIGILIHALWSAAPVLAQYPQSPERQQNQQVQDDPEDNDQSTTGQNLAPLSIDQGPQMFFDANITQFSKDSSRQVFEGDVVAIGGGVLITADRISLNRNTQILEASGHVIILAGSQVFSGESVTYNLKTTDFEIIKASMLSNDPATAQKISNEVFGFTTAELEFETKRKLRLDHIYSAKEKLRQKYRLTSRKGDLPEEEVISQYSILLEQEDLTKIQENPALGRLSDERRSNFKNRRKYWEESQKDSIPLGTGSSGKYYFRIDGDKIERTSQNDYAAHGGIWTPCLCEEDETPAWGFNADRIDAQMGGYADLYHPILEIKGVPVLYLPYLKVPIKSKRQSGFLMPSISTGGNNGSGTIYTQPVYFAFDDNLDSTFTSEIMQNRGTKLALETRYQQKQYSGWQLNLESIRDRIWLKNRGMREQELEYYRSLPENQEDPSKLKPIEEHLKVPPNTWRGSQKWRGLNIISPRLSAVSEGTMYSDHRYVEDMFVPTTFEESFNLGRQKATLIAPTKGRLHLDGKDFYVGTGTSLGDNMIQEERFQGLQMPQYFVLQSRLYELDPKHVLPIPIYAQVSGDHREIKDFMGAKRSDPNSYVENSSLKSGHWQKAEMNFTAPLISKGIIKVDHFTDLEARNIRHEGLNDKNSSIRTWKSGIAFNLPIDGEGRLPDRFQPKEGDPDFGSTKYGRHEMNWQVRFSTRPVVVRNGPYGEEAGNDLVYFVSDRKSFNDDLGVVDRVDVMRTHKNVAFSTSHAWLAFNRNWKLISGSKSAVNPNVKETYQQRARRELLYSLDPQVSSYDQMFNPKNEEDWFINRYQITESEKFSPLSLSANIDYDFEIAKEREEAKRNGEEYSTKPWSDLYSTIGMSLFGLGLTTKIQYDIYIRTSENLDFNLMFPSFLSTSLSLGYTIRKEAHFEDGKVKDFSYVRTRRLTATSGIIPRTYSKGEIAQRQEEGEPITYETRLGFEYLSYSNCWKIFLARVKAFGDDEKDASYQLNLTVLFMGQERPLGTNLAEPVLREVRGDES